MTVVEARSWPMELRTCGRITPQALLLASSTIPQHGNAVSEMDLNNHKAAADL